MDKGYEVYCLADRDFYDCPIRTRGDDVDFPAAERPLPEGWKRAEFDDWLAFLPEGTVLPPQGWKIHVSTCLDNACAVLEVVYRYCVQRRLAFKFVRSEQLLFLRNVKYASRGSSGKFVTIYPTDEAQLEQVATELGAELEGQPGPYILSDLRIGEGPLYVRYGGFAERYCVGAGGERELALEDGSGTLVPDRRGATFKVPDWVALPAFLAPHLEARNRTTVADLPYRIESALHFSNGGGVYRGVDTRTGETVVLKEARPHAGLSVDRADAVSRLQRERDVLRRLDGLGVAPALRDYFVLGDHHFLVQDYVEGTTLNKQIVRRYPLTELDDFAAPAAEYAEWALDAYGRVERAVEAVHERGIVVGDLHPANVLVREDGSVVLIDLEVATDVGDGRRPTLADPAFIAPGTHSGLEVDRYALACMRLYLFMPLTTLLGQDLGKAQELADAVAAAFPVPREWLDEAVRVITTPAAGTTPARPPRARPRPLEPTPEGWREAGASMAAAILASATPQRADRLFPGDPKQFTPGGGLNLAHGAAGVLFALHATGHGRHPEHEEWLVRRALDPEPRTPLGFYDGLHGVAYALHALGRGDDALRVLEICLSELRGKTDLLGLDLLGGLAGVGLNLAHFAEVTGDAALWDAAWEVADAVAARLGDEDSVGETSGGDQPWAGFTRGSSGPALLFLRMHRRSGDPGLLDLAAVALRQDLRRCVPAAAGSLEVDEGWRTMPYLADGSVGIGVVLDEYLAMRGDDAFAEASAAIRRAALAPFYIEPGLFYGRAGMIAYLSRRHAPGRAAAADPVVASHIRRLGWHALTFRGHLAFPGEFLLRLSMDLASGTSGVLLALGAALHDAPVHLPLLEAPLRRPPETEGQLADSIERR